MKKSNQTIPRSVVIFNSPSLMPHRQLQFVSTMVDDEKKNFFQSCMEPRTNSSTFSWREPVLKLRHLSIIACIFCVLACERTYTHTHTFVSLYPHSLLFYSPPQVRFDLRKIEGRRQLSKEINAKSGKFTFVSVRTWTADEGRHLQSKVTTMVILF